jgi:hypothetical protein
MPDDLFKAGIECHDEVSGAKAALQASGNVKLLRIQNGSWVGRPPKNRLVFAVPGKDASTVGFEEPLESEIAPDGEQALWRGLLNGRKGKVVRISAQPHHG